MNRLAFATAVAVFAFVPAGLVEFVSGHPAASLQAPVIVHEGLLAAESALHDTTADVYLVSNVNGGPSNKDDNGFISRVTPEGKVENLKWIDGAAGDVTLNAPKGLAFRGNLLLVADIDTVRLFDRQTGKSAGEWPIQGATFLNGIDVAPDGSVYVTDTAITLDGGQAKPQGNAAIYRFESNQKQPTILAQGAALHGPNGIVATPEGAVFVTFLDNRILRVKGKDAAPETIATLPGGQLDGLARLSDGSYAVSSWAARGVYRVSANGQAKLVLTGLTSPAGLDVDEKRRRVIVPQLFENRVHIAAFE
jgi:sugar lactone lactonase YvrE